MIEAGAESTQVIDGSCRLLERVVAYVGMVDTAMLGGKRNEGEVQSQAERQDNLDPNWKGPSLNLTPQRFSWEARKVKLPMPYSGV